MTDAAKLIQAGAEPELADQMFLALRNVANLDDQLERFAAYFMANVDLNSPTWKEQQSADAIALSMELMRRLAGYQ